MAFYEITCASPILFLDLFLNVPRIEQLQQTSEGHINSMFEATCIKRQDKFEQDYKK